MLIDSLFRSIKSLLVSFWFMLGGAPRVMRIDGKKFLLRREHFQARHALRHGWEDLFLSLEMLVDSETLFFDIGANVGIASVLLAPTARQVFAFEPTPEAFADLASNIRLNDCSNVTPIPVALSRVSGIQAMRNSPCWGHNSIVKNSDSSLGKPVINVPVMTLDLSWELLIQGWSGQSESQRLLIKIDVEGHELDVLYGSRSLLESRDNIVICFEAWDCLHGDPCVAFLEGLGFEKMQPPLGNGCMDVFMRKS